MFLTFSSNVASQNSTSVLVDVVLSFLADDGWLHRAVDINGEMHIIEELQLFDQPQPIESLVISPTLVCIHVWRVIQNDGLFKFIYAKVMQIRAMTNQAHADSLTAYNIYVF